MSAFSSIRACAKGLRAQEEAQRISKMVHDVDELGFNYKEEEEALAELLLEEYDCVAVFLDEELITSFYHGFCRGYLRPILHNQLVVPTEKDPYSEDEWRAYW